MADATGLLDIFRFSGRTTGYDEVRLKETRRLGRIAALLAVGLLPWFIWQDLVVLQISDFLPARLLCLGLFALSGLVLWFRKSSDRLVYVVHGAALGGLVAMGCHLFSIIFLHYQNELVHKDMVSNTLVLLLFACFLFAGGLRPYLFVLMGVPLLVLVLVLGFRGGLNLLAWSWLSNPLLIMLVLIVMSFVQEASRQREYVNLATAQLRFTQVGEFLDAICDSACMLDDHGQVVLANQAMAARLGRPLRGILGQPIWEFWPAQGTKERREMINQVIRNGKIKHYEDIQGGQCFEEVIYPVKDAKGVVRFLAILGKDVSVQKKKIDELVYEAMHDPLTGLANRRTLDSRLRQANSRARRGYPSCLLYLDLDNFKEVNDRNDHATGDSLLIALTGILLDGERDQDSVFRVGGDEFAVLVDGATLLEGSGVAQRICHRVADCDFSSLMAQSVPVSLSIGCVELSGRANPDRVIRYADEAMYRAKRAGRNRVELGGGPSMDDQR